MSVGHADQQGSARTTKTASDDLRPCAVVVVDSDRTIRHWDDGASDLFGYTSAEAEGKSLDLIDPDASRAWRARSQHRPIAAGPTWIDGAEIVERPVRCSDGTVRPFAARLASMRDPHDRTIGTAIVFTDEPVAKPVSPEPAVTGRGWFAPLERYKYVSLATRRRNGTIVPTTVWFAVHGDSVYVNTDQRSAKVKRIRNDPRVTLCPCTVRGRLLGNALEGLAYIVPRADQARPDSFVRAKYRWRYAIATAYDRERMEQYSELIEIVPPGSASRAP